VSECDHTGLKMRRPGTTVVVELRKEILGFYYISFHKFGKHILLHYKI